MTVGGIISKSFVARLVKYIGYRTILTTNTVLLGCFIAAFSFIKPNTHIGIIFGIFFIFGIINSTQFTAMNSVTLVDLAPEQEGSGNTLLSVIMQLSISLGIAISAALLAGFSGVSSITGIIPDGVIDAFKKTYICLGVIAVFATLIFIGIPSKSGKESTKKNTQPTPHQPTSAND